MPVAPNNPNLGPIDVFRSGSRKHGATQKQFQDFVRAADAGLRVEMHGQNYVAMSRNMYEELRRASNPINVTIEELTFRGEEPTISDDAWAEMNFILDADREAKASRPPRPPANPTGKIRIG